MTPRLYAWAHALTSEQAVRLSREVPGLGLVLNIGNFEAARDLTIPAIAYLTTRSAARVFAVIARDRTLAPAGFTLAVIDDERNEDGPSGWRLEPDAYAQRFADIRAEVPVSVPISTMGLQALGGWKDDLLRTRRFDDAYHAQLPPADVRAFNPNKVRAVEIERAMRLDAGRRWLLSPAPVRSPGDQLLSPVGVGGWAKLAADPRVVAVAMWCLREHYDGRRWQREHGLFDRYGNLTSVGQQVKARLT